MTEMPAPPLSEKQYGFGIIVESWRLLEAMQVCGDLELRRISNWKLDSDYFEFEASSLCIGAIMVAQGAAMVADAAERLVSSGAKNIVRLGTAGALSEKISVGDIAISLAATKDEGVSRHYLPSTVPAVCSFSLVNELYNHLKIKVPRNVHQGVSWTTDGRWMEDDHTIASYQKLSIVTVDMETCTLYSVAMVRSVNAASVSVIADLVFGDKGNIQKGVNNDEDDWKCVVGSARNVILSLCELARRDWC